MPAPNIYLLPKNLLVGLIGPMKSSLHFMNGFFSIIVINFVKLKVFKPHVCWHKSQLQQHSITSFNNVAQQYLAYRILVVMFITKWPPTMPSCSWVKAQSSRQVSVLLWAELQVP
jgi:predicted ABC-type exoprotein transport system permease subunit